MPTRSMLEGSPASARVAARVATSSAGSVAAVLALLAAGACGVAQAAEPRVRIAEPANGAKLDAMEQNRLVYEVDPGPRGDHVHVYVDDKEVGILRQLQGSYALETLAPGARTICIKIVNKAHTPTGVEDCVTAQVE